MSIYRQYEDPYVLEDQLAKAREELHKAYSLGADVYELQDLQLEIAELEERVNFAWQDDEFEEDYARENYPEEYARGEWR